MRGVAFLVVTALVLLGAFYWLDSKTYEQAEPAPEVLMTDHKNAEYIFSGERVRLTDGVGETDQLMGSTSSPPAGSASKTVIRYFGNELRTDLNADGKEDVVFLVTQQSGGSGTFFYAVAALQTAEGYVGSEAVLIGDRIAPQSTNVDERGFVVVNYAERKSGEPMTTQPSVGKSLYLKFNAATMQFGEVVQDFEGESDEPKAKQ